MIQEKNHTSSHFSHRTEILSEKLGLKMHDLSVVLGISKRMLFGYRSGVYPISSKAWRKLEDAEKMHLGINDDEKIRMTQTSYDDGLDAKKSHLEEESHMLYHANIQSPIPALHQTYESALARANANDLLDVAIQQATVMQSMHPATRLRSYETLLELIAQARVKDHTQIHPPEKI